MNSETIPMFDSLPMDNPGAVKKPVIDNNLSSNLCYLLDVFDVSIRKIAQATEIPDATIGDWVNGKVRLQLLDHRLVRLAKYFDRTLEELVFEDLRKAGNK